MICVYSVNCQHARLQAQELHLRCCNFRFTTFPPKLCVTRINKNITHTRSYSKQWEQNMLDLTSEVELSPCSRYSLLPRRHFPVTQIRCYIPQSSNPEYVSTMSVRTLSDVSCQLQSTLTLPKRVWCNVAPHLKVNLLRTGPKSNRHLFIYVKYPCLVIDY